jgi:hypothetical protein
MLKVAFLIRGLTGLMSVGPGTASSSAKRAMSAVSLGMCSATRPAGNRAK